MLSSGICVSRILTMTRQTRDKSEFLRHASTPFLSLLSLAHFSLFTQMFMAAAKLHWRSQAEGFSE
jgi:hypothetical protein